MAHSNEPAADSIVAKAPRDGWCFIGFTPAPRWHHHMSCMETPPSTDDFGDLVHRLWSREGWVDAFEHRTYLMFALHSAEVTGDTHLAEDLLQLEADLFRVIPRLGGGRPGVHYFDEPAPEVLPHDRRLLWPEYECKILAVTDWHQIELGTIPFRFDGLDPHWTFLHAWSPPTGSSRPDSETVAREIHHAALEWIEDHEGWVAGSWEIDALAESVRRLLDSSPGGLVFGVTRWGDILLNREVAYEYADAARWIQQETTRAELLYRLPASALDRIHVPWDEEDGYDYENEEDGDTEEDETIENWSWYIESDSWPWLLTHEPQARSTAIPDDAETEEVPTLMDGTGLVWTDADRVINQVWAAGVPIERDDLLVDRAMGPHGYQGTWNEQELSDWECTCEQPAWTCDCHPAPTTKGDLCPACGSNQVVRVGYGFPDFSNGWQRDSIVGGCIIRDSARGCRACDTLFDHNGNWLRESFSDRVSEVSRHPVPPQDRGLTALYLAATRVYDDPLGISPAVLHELTRSGVICGGWWTRIPGLASGCACRGKATGTRAPVRLHPEPPRNLVARRGS